MAVDVAAGRWCWPCSCVVDRHRPRQHRPWCWSAMFLLGAAEVFADTTTSTLLPMLVDKRRPRHRQRPDQAGFITANQLVGPPIGAAALRRRDGVAVRGPGRAAWRSGSVLVSRHRYCRAARCASDVEHARAPRHRRGLALAAGTTRRCAPWRWSSSRSTSPGLCRGRCWCCGRCERLGMGEVGFGLLTTVAALGGLLGTSAYGWLERRVAAGHADAGRCWLIEVVTHLALALTTSPWVAYLLMFSSSAPTRSSGARSPRRCASARCRPRSRAGSGRSTCSA